MNQAAAIYARVSSDRQKESDTIASQTAALVEYAKAYGTPCRRNGSSKTKGIVAPVWCGPVWRHYVI